MFSAKLRTTAAVLVAAAGLAFTASAHATKVSSQPTGNGSLDAYCAAAADLINQAFAEGEHADNMGYYDEGQAWWDTAIEMLSRAKANGCNFSQARILAQGVAHRPGGLAVATEDPAPPANVVVVSALPTGNVRLDVFCRDAATKANQAYRSGNATYAAGIRKGAEGKGCRFIAVRRVAVAPQATTVSAG